MWTVPTRFNYTVLTNSMEIDTHTEDNYTIYEFHEFDVPIPTYLVAFSIGRFDYIETDQLGIRFRSYASPTQVHLLQHQLNETVKSISVFTNLFGVPLPLQKLDACTIPERGGKKKF